MNSCVPGFLVFLLTVFLWPINLTKILHLAQKHYIKQNGKNRFANSKNKLTKDIYVHLEFFLSRGFGAEREGTTVLFITIVSKVLS